MRFIPIAFLGSLLLCIPSMSATHANRYVQNKLHGREEQQIRKISFWPFGGNTITRAQVEEAGGLWPLTVDRISYRCTTAAGKKVAVYEFPSGGGDAKYFRLIGTPTVVNSVNLSGSSSIWKARADIPGAKVNISDLSRIGDARCK
jgi:hypothetical protein